MRPTQPSQKPSKWRYLVPPTAAIPLISLGDAAQAPAVRSLAKPIAKSDLYDKESTIFQDQENHTSSVASWDVFQFSDGRLVEITAYVIELNKL